MAKRRFSLTMDEDVADRLDRVVARLPGATRSGVIEEFLGLALPDLEDLVEALSAARDETTGTLDEAAARERLALWVGTRMLRMTAPYAGEEEPG